MADGGAPLQDPLLAALNLDYPGLEEVRAACAAGDVAAARLAFAAHLRARKKPVWTYDPSAPLPPLSAGDRSVADAALEHRFTVVFIPYTFAEKIDWNFNPTRLPDSKFAVDNEWVWQFNRHEFWPPLSRAYCATGDAKYAAELVEEIKDWVAANPVPSAADKSHFDQWRTIEAGLRTGYAWPDVFVRMIRHREAFPDDVALTMVESFAQHAEWLYDKDSRGNFLFMMANGLYATGTLFPEFKRAAAWRQRATEWMQGALTDQIYADGVQYELTPHYHIVTIWNSARILQLAELNGNQLPSRYLSQLEKMYAILPWVSGPDRVIPALNDGSSPRIVKEMANAMKIFPNREDWRFFATDGVQGAAPIETSRLLDWSGWAAMRSGWDKDACYLLLDAGPFGCGHQHEDKLSFVINAFQCHLLFEAGSYAYDASDLRKYVLSARGHNVVHVDGMEQHRGGRTLAEYIAASPAALVWETKPEYDYVSASYGKEPIEGWGPKRLKNVVHTRRILFVKPDIWIVVDSLVPTDVVEHVYESTFHLNSTSAAVDPATLSASTQNEQLANLSIIPLRAPDLTAQVITGQMQPVVQGWLPYGHGQTGAWPRPCVYYTRKGTGPVHFLYAFSPYKLGDAPKVASVTPGAGAGPLSALVSLTGGAKIAVSLTASGEMVVDGVGGKPLHLAAG
ncbi:MAG: heparinase II/III family protein [Capsulimonadaceae bacterium]|nr:heparinase II/III family protein [Capsulimonadaceae bacterium]